MNMNRREFLMMGGAAFAAGCTATGFRNRVGQTGAGEFHVFSKMFQPPVVETPEKLCELMKGAGFDGIQWTVRKGGHATPENVRTELPRLCRIAESFGLRNRTICTDITVDASGKPGLSNGAETTLKIAADSGIEMFRTAYFFYDTKRETFRQSLDRIRGGFDALAHLAAKTGVKAVYQNHSSWGPSVFGGVVWDIYECIRNLDPADIGLEYDPMHAYFEMNLSWSHGLDLIAPWIAAVDLKDFHYCPDPKNPKKMKKRMVAACEGIVPWGETRTLLDANGVKPLYVVHFEYDFDKTDLPSTVKNEIESFKKALRMEKM